VGVGSRGGKTEWEPKVVGETEHIDPLDYQQSVVDDKNAPRRDRLQASALLAPFKHVKPTGTKLATVVDLPPPTTIDQALEQRGQIMGLEQLRLITKEDATQLITELDGWVFVKRGPDHEQRLQAIKAKVRGEQDAPQVQFIVESPLGMLPVGEGEPSVIMPSNVRVIDTRPEEEKPGDDQSGGTRSEDSGLGGCGVAQGAENQGHGRDADEGRTGGDAEDRSEMGGPAGSGGDQGS
jgi:hypothetical protein